MNVKNKKLLLSFAISAFLLSSPTYTFAASEDIDAQIK